MSSLSSAGSSTDIQNLSKSFPTLLLNLFSFNCFPFGTYCINPGSLPNGGILITGFPVLFSRDCGNWSLEILEMRSESPLDFTGMEISTNTARYIPAIVSPEKNPDIRRQWSDPSVYIHTIMYRCQSLWLTFLLSQKMTAQVLLYTGNTRYNYDANIEISSSFPLFKRKYRPKVDRL